MALSNFFSWLNPRRARADRARSDLQANAEKALRMKEEGEAGTQIPPYQTAHEGMRDHSRHDDRTPAPEGHFTPELKRSRVARSGDTS